MADRVCREIGALSVLEKEILDPVFCKRGMLDFLFLGSEITRLWQNGKK